MSTLVLATRNKKKVVELQAVLAEYGHATAVHTLEAYPDAPPTTETEPTFAGNALLKARAVARHTGLAAVADDSGLCVDALNGMPGVLSARWSGRFGEASGEQDTANLQLVLDQLADVPTSRRSAQFVAVIALAVPGVAGGEAELSEHVVEGSLSGHLVAEPRGSHGFGYDPIFVPDSCTRTTAELSPAEKNAISHRGIALRRLAEQWSTLV